MWRVHGPEHLFFGTSQMTVGGGFGGAAKGGLVAADDEDEDETEAQRKKRERWAIFTPMTPPEPT